MIINNEDTDKEKMEYDIKLDIENDTDEEDIEEVISFNIDKLKNIYSYIKNIYSGIQCVICGERVKNEDV